METQKRPEPPVLKRDGFQYGKDGLSVSNIDRIDGSRLKQLFNPGSLRLKQDQKKAEETARTLFKKPFLAAQLRYYGIKTAASASKPELYNRLNDAVSQGKCDQVPEEVVLLEQLMQRDYEPLYQEWETVVRAWDEEKNRRDDEAFSKCTTPGQKASFDLNRFMNFYFLTDGKPDQDKTPEALALYGFNETWRLHQIVHSTPGLHTRSGGLDQDQTLCIGWNQSEVLSLAKHIDDQAAEAQNKRRQAWREKEMDAHEKYVSQSSQSKPKKNNGKGTAEKESAESFDLQQCKGSYVVRCEAVTEGWSDEYTGGKLTLDIANSKNGVLVADYHFGIIEGTMLLSLDKEQLDLIAGGDSDSEAHSDDEAFEFFDHDINEPDSEEKQKPEKKSLARAAAASNQAQQSTGRAAKRRKMMPSLSRRVYYKMRGRETGEGEVFPGPESGHLDFLSDECLRFAGLAYYFPYISKNVEFQGYKISASTRKKPTAFGNFDDSGGRYGWV